MTDNERYSTGNDYEPKETHRSGHNADLSRWEGVGDRLGKPEEPSAETAAAREQQDAQDRGGIAARLGGPTPAPTSPQPDRPTDMRWVSDVLDGEIDTADEVSTFTSAGQLDAE